MEILVCDRKCKEKFWKWLRMLTSPWFSKMHTTYLKEYSQGKLYKAHYLAVVCRSLTKNSVFPRNVIWESQVLFRRGSD